MDEEFGIGIETDLSFEQAVVRTRVALMGSGFGILSEMTPPPTVGDQIGRKHLFLSVWQRIISTDNLGGEGLDVGDHLPVSVVVFEDGDHSVVAVLDPADGMDGWDDSEIEKARESVEKMLTEITSGPDYHLL